MRKTLVALVCLVGLPCLAHAQSVSIDLDAGVLRTAPAAGQTLGTALPDGTLLELIASPSGNFTAPTASSFTSGDEIVLEKFSLDSTTTGNTGEFEQTFNINVSPMPGATVSSGEKYELIWFPGLTMASTAPGAGQSYGTYRSDSLQGNGDTAAFVIPNSGATVNTLFTTVSSNSGGPEPDVDGNASMTVAGTPLPEPSTYAMMGFATFGLIGLRLRQRRMQQS